MDSVFKRFMNDEVSLQEVFDASARAIIKQGVPAYDRDTGNCFYGDASGRRCAIGALLDSKELSDVRGNQGNGWSVSILAKHFGYQVRIVNIALAAKLQCAHDEAARSGDYFLFAYKNRMTNLARELELNTNALSE